MENCTFYYDFRLVFLKRNIFQWKNFYQNFYENFSKVTIFEEIILQQLKISTKIFTHNIREIYLLLWFSISISKEKHIPVKIFSSKNFMKNFPKLLSLRKWFCNHKKCRPKLLIKILKNCTFYYDFRLVFLKRNIFQWKKFHQKFLWKFFQGYYLWGNNFATIKNFD